MSLFHFALASNIHRITPTAAIAENPPKAHAIGEAYDRIVPTGIALAAARTNGLKGKAADNGGVDKDALARAGGELVKT